MKASNGTPGVSRISQFSCLGIWSPDFPKVSPMSEHGFIRICSSYKLLPCARCNADPEDMNRNDSPRERHVHRV